MGRSFYAAVLILDDKPGMLDLMVESAYPGYNPTKPEFGEEILGVCREIAGKISDKYKDGDEGEGEGKKKKKKRGGKMERKRKEKEKNAAAEAHG